MQAKAGYICLWLWLNEWVKGDEVAQYQRVFWVAVIGVTLLLVLKELEKKVSQTAPFQNLKQMLQKKNDQIKDLRRRLSKYVSLFSVILFFTSAKKVMILP